MLPRLIALAVTSGLAVKAWDRYRQPKPRLPEDITELVARPEAARPAKPQKAAKQRRREGPGA